MAKTYLFHGPSGSGKDTQVEKLMQISNNFERIATGEMFRTLYNEGDPEGIEAQKIWSKGIFNPDDQVYGMLDKWVKRFDQSKDWIFVSAVRSKGQIMLFDNLLSNNNRQLDLFIHFKLSIENAIERRCLRRTCPKCQATYHPKYRPEKNTGFCDNDGEKLIQREDDTEEATRSLMNEYNKDINPILEAYKKRGILVEIDAAQSIDAIHEQVKKALGINNE